MQTAVQTHLKKLDIIQRTAARIIYEVPRDTHAEPLLILHRVSKNVPHMACYNFDTHEQN